MSTLIVSLPAIRKSLRKIKKLNAETKTNIITSTERVRKHRQKLKKDEELLEKAKLKKKEANRKYKETVKKERESNTVVDERMKAKQREWKKKSRKRKAAKSGREQKSISSQTKSRRTSKQKNVNIRKSAERARRHLPESPRAWANTMDHIVKNATPRRLSHMNMVTTKDTENVEEVLGINKIGRPRKDNEKVKRKLAFSGTNNTIKGKVKWNMNRYMKRKNVQLNRISKPLAYRAAWKDRITEFLDSNSRVMPNKRDTLLINGETVPKHHLLSSKLKLYRKFKKLHQTFSRKFSTFENMIPRNYRCLNLACRRVCVCMKDYNLEQQILALNKVAQGSSNNDLQTTIRELSDISVCPYDKIPARKCVDRECQNCGTDSIQNLYEPLINNTTQNLKVKYIQWEQASEMYTNRKGETKKTKRWIQAEKKESMKEIVEHVTQKMGTFTSHLFRADFQHKVETEIMCTLPIDHCLVVMDFSENVTLEPQDEIESAHWTQKQITLHPIYIVRHGEGSTEEEPIITKESLIILSDCLTHDARAVYIFTEQLLIHLQNNPGPVPISIIHRFSDNCAAQYKSKTAFEHIMLLEQKYNIELVYHYTESGHGKGPSDGLGAGIKKRLERLILGGKVINTTYQAYLALRQHPSDNLRQQVIYVPAKMMKSAPQKSASSKSVPGTQSFHMVKQWKPSTGILTCCDLSCSCPICIAKEEGPCFFMQFRRPDKFIRLQDGKQILFKDLNTLANLADNMSSNPTNACVDSHPGGGESGVPNTLVESIISLEIERSRHDKIMADFEEKIKAKAWKIRGKTPEDGNCFFWAVSDQLDRVMGRAQTHTQLRKSVVEHIQDLSEEAKLELNEFITSDLHSYVSNMSKDGTYADHPCISIISKVLSTSILIVHSNNPNIQVDGGDEMLAIGYIPELQHYVSLEPAERYAPQDFVAVKLSSRRNKQYLYLAKVVKLDEPEIQLRFLQKTGRPGVYTWSNDEVSWQSVHAILQTLTQPKLLPGRGIKMEFNIPELERAEGLIPSV